MLQQSEGMAMPNVLTVSCTVHLSFFTADMHILGPVWAARLAGILYNHSSIIVQVTS